MNASGPHAHSTTQARMSEPARDAMALADEDDFAIGCECANPALQIEMWGAEAVAQPLQMQA